MTAAEKIEALPRLHPARRQTRRVLFLADHLGMPDGGVHGVTTYLLDVLPALLASGVEVGACFLREEHAAAESLRAGGIRVRFLHSGRFDLLVAREVADLVHREGWNILHCTQFRASIISRAVARMRPHLSAVLHIHDLTIPPPVVRLLNRVLANPKDLGLCVSTAAREVAIRGYGIRPGRVRVLYTGIDGARFRPLSQVDRIAIRRELNLPVDAPLLCLVGRFQPVKGQRDMLRIFQRIVGHRPDCVLLLVGSGPDRAVCEQRAEQRQLQRNVRFVGYRHDVHRLMAAADVAVVPSRSEGLSRFAIEANFCGVPVVAFDSGGIADVLVDPVCGELVPPGDDRAFSDAVLRALQRSRSPSFAHARSHSARDRFGLAGHVDALRSCYDALETE